MAEAGALRNLLAAWSRLLLSSLADAGVTDVVLSPGSRSTPFMVAAETEARLRCYDSIDERAAAFFALGQARVTGRPAVVICTSGTAVSHYLPAIVEANVGGVPLIVLSSDRPLELQDSAAAQTIDQVKLFGDQVRRFYELGAPDPAPSALAGLRRIAAQAVFRSCGGGGAGPGPVHLNARARKPLEPVAATTAAERSLDAMVDGLLGRPIVAGFRSSLRADPGVVASVAGLCQASERGVIVAGPAPVGAWPDPEVADRLSSRLGYPLLAETTSQLRLRLRRPSASGATRADAFAALLRSDAFRPTHTPDVVIQLGGAPTSSGFEQLCGEVAGGGSGHRSAHVVVHPHTWVDPSSSATHVILADPASFVADLLQAIGPTDRGKTDWSASWQEADEGAWSALDEVLGDTGLTEAQLVRTLLPALPPGSLLMVGNSLPIRNVDTYCRSGIAEVDVLSQRGANGIDGLIAGAAGSATVAGRPVTLLVGDVSLLHDLTGLALGALVTDVPLVVVVANNNGGRIFETLPITRSGLGPEYLNHVTTPHDFALGHAARIFGHRFTRVTDAGGLAAALGQAWSEPGCHVIEAAVPSDGGSAGHEAVLSRIDATAGSRSAPGRSAGDRSNREERP